MAKSFCDTSSMYGGNDRKDCSSYYRASKMRRAHLHQCNNDKMCATQKKNERLLLSSSLSSSNLDKDKATINNNDRNANTYFDNRNFCVSRLESSASSLPASSFRISTSTKAMDKMDFLPAVSQHRDLEASFRLSNYCNHRIHHCDRHQDKSHNISNTTSSIRTRSRRLKRSASSNWPMTTQAPTVLLALISCLCFFGSFSSFSIIGEVRASPSPLTNLEAAHTIELHVDDARRRQVYDVDDDDDDDLVTKKLQPPTQPQKSTSSSSTNVIINEGNRGAGDIEPASVNQHPAAAAAAAAETASGTPVGAPISSIKPDLYGLIGEVHVECNSADILITLSPAVTTAAHPFNGMIYPKGLSKNSSCMAEYSGTNNFTYRLPLRACNTMSTDVTDGIEYFNTVIVQPHRRLVTNQGRGYHIRCRYQTREKRITNSNLNVSMSAREGVDGGLGGMQNTPLTATAPIPTSSMKIYVTGSTNLNEIVAENVKIGDKLSLSISIGEQDIYGMKVTNCLVRDGLNWGEQPLINDEGCPVDKEIMGPFEYGGNLTRAHVSFHAHKFPYTSSVYYQCNVRLCLKDNGGCDDVPPSCDRNGRNYRHVDQAPDKRQRSRRTTAGAAGYDAVVVPTSGAGQYPNLASALASRLASQKGDKDMSMEVYSGLYVDESDNNAKNIARSADDKGSRDEDEDDDELDDVSGRVRSRKASESEEFCISMRKFAIGVAIASLLLMFAVILLVVCILQRRRRRNAHRRLYGSSAAGDHSTIGSSGSIYSGSGGPYTNRAYT